MSAASDYLEVSIINVYLRGGPYTGSTVYIALFTADPADADGGTELGDSGYARQTATFDQPDATGGSTANSAAITFPAIVDAQATVTHWGIVDASGTDLGNLLFHSALTNSKTLDPTDVLSFPIGALTVTVS